MKISLLTPTGDRPASLLRQRKYIEKSIYPSHWKVQWLVIDDGLKPFNPGGCEYRRREPDGYSSLERQMKSIGKLDSDYVLIWEDDEWYSKERIKRQVLDLRGMQIHLHGYVNAIYYNVPTRTYRENKNNQHASFCETGMTTALWNQWVDSLQYQGEGVFLDIPLWKDYRQCSKMVPNQPRVSLGLKGMPGRKGLGLGHDKGHCKTEDTDLKFLRSIVPEEDVQEILKEVALDPQH